MNTLFEKVIAMPESRICEICGDIMAPMYGGGFNYDRLICANPDCGTEVTFASSTEAEPKQPTETTNKKEGKEK